MTDTNQTADGAPSGELAKRLERFKMPTLKEFIDFAKYRAQAKRDYAAECDSKGHEGYAEEINEDAELIEIAAAALDAKDAEIAQWKEAASTAGVCMSCALGAPEPAGCTDCLNTGWNGGAPIGFVSEDKIAHLQSRIAELEAAPARVPDGWQLVPKEPTAEIIEAGAERIYEIDGSWNGTWQEFSLEEEKDVFRLWAAESYRSALTAAPSPPAPAQSNAG